MARIYIDADGARFTPGVFHLVSMETPDGVIREDIEPRRLFPVSGLRKYISLLDSQGHEIAIIRDLDTLMPESKRVVENSLDEYYLIPKITKILDRSEKYGILKWEADTDRGVRSFTISNRNADIKALFDGRVLIRDSNDNRYEIPDLNALDAGSLRLLSMDL